MSLSAQQNEAILQGVASCDTFFYMIGGAVLVVMAGMWGFHKVAQLLGDHSGEGCSADSEDFFGDSVYEDASGSIFNQGGGERLYLSERAENPAWRD